MTSSFFLGFGRDIFKNKRWFERRSWRGFFFLFPKKAKSATQSCCLENKHLKVEFGMGELLLSKKLRQLHLEVDGRSVVTLWDSKENFAPIFRFYCGCEALSKTRMFFQPLEDKRNW